MVVPALKLARTAASAPGVTLPPNRGNHGEPACAAKHHSHDRTICTCVEIVEWSGNAESKHRAAIDCCTDACVQKTFDIAVTARHFFAAGLARGGNCATSMVVKLFEKCAIFASNSAASGSGPITIAPLRKPGRPTRSDPLQ